MRGPAADPARIIYRQRMTSLANGFDVPVLAAYLHEHLGTASALKVTALSGGQSNPTYLLDAGGQKLVLRKKPAGDLLPSAHAVDREFRVISALYGTDIPVARPYLYCDDASIVGTPFYVMAHVDGRQLPDPTLPGLANEERSAIWSEFNRVVAALHTFDYAAKGLSDYGKPGNYFDRQVQRWTRQYHAAETERIEPMDRLIEWLPANIPASDQTALVHGDLRIDNLIFDRASPRILAMLDWELSTLGHPLADLAYHMMTWRLTSGQFRGMGEHDLGAIGIPSEREYLRWYCERTRRAPIDSDEWEFCMAFSMFRLAAILQGITKRAIQGTAASASAAETGGRARSIAEAGWEQARRIGARN